MKKSLHRTISILVVLLLSFGLVFNPTNAVISTPDSIDVPKKLFQDGWNVDFIGHIGGNSNAVAVQGDYAYIGEGGRLTILNITNPASPVVIGKTVPFPGMVSGITVSDSYAYIAAMEAGLRIIDVSDPAYPFEVGYYDTTGTAYGVALSGETAYIADFDAGLRVLDVNDPTSPEEVGFFNTAGEARSVAISGSYAYVADGNTGLRVVNISDPINPYEISSYDSPGSAYGVVVSGGYAYLADLHSMRVINITNPSNPFEQGALGYGVPLVYALVYSSLQEYVYVAMGEYGLDLVDVSDKSNPHPHGSYNTPGNSVGVDILMGNIYLADMNFGLRIVDINNPNAPVEVGFYDGSGPCMAQNVTVLGEYAYVADDDNGLRIVNVTDVNDPVEVGMYDTPADTHDVVVSGEYAYIVDGSRGLRIIDISNPSNPDEVGFYDTPGNAFAVDFSAGYVYVADQGAGLRVIDVSDPTNPVEVGYYIPPGTDANGVAIFGSYAYLAAGFAGLRVLNVSNPTNPYEVGFYDTQSSAVDIAIFGEYAYVADNEDGLRVVDISDPTDPDEVGFYDTSGLADSVAVSEGYAYVADGYNGLRVVDVNDPTNPEEVGFYITPGWAFGVAISGEYVYVADREGGLLILYFSPPQNQPPVALNDSGLGFITDEDTAFLTASVFLNDYDPDGDPLVVESFDDSGIIGVLIYNGEGTFAYYPEDQFDWLSTEAQALDVFTYVVSDGVLTDTATVTITINGVNDVPVVDVGTNLEADEGEEVSFSGGFSDPDWSEGTIHWDFGDGITATNTLTPTHSYGDNGTYTVTLTVTDTFGGSVSDWLTASVSNVAPTIYEMSDFTVVSGKQFTITGVFTDPGWLDSYEVVIFWTQDIIEYFYLDAGVTEFNANFTFPKVGEYSIMIYVIDDDHAAGGSAFMVTVIDEWLKMYLPSITR